MTEDIILEKIKEAVRLKYLEVNKSNPSDTEVVYLLSNLWYIAKGERVTLDFLTKEEEDTIMLIDPTKEEEDIATFIINYENKLKTDYSPIIEMLKSSIKQYKKNYIKKKLT